MELFIDSADIEELRRCVAGGLVDGVTTNPSLVAKTGRPFHETVVAICELVGGPVSAEVTATDAAPMLEQARELAALHEHVVVKLPLTRDGLQTCRALADDGIKTNVTLCFSAVQGLLAAKAGATYVSPFIGRLDDIGQAGMDLIRDLRQVYDNYGFETKVLAASIRHTEHLLQAALAGADAATIPAGVFDKLLNHPLTDSGLERFLADWKKAGL
ncbi:fructose-6-phosphate aldolase [Abyssibacter profundi]|uniref:Probable transaldolase n=1 Tax=Abyssibacter profundi TaxID=2182787 RepID=A0A363ULY2_9GAMM|nr:fructose-6-phosphate aldolase [Abyssibacter profundi]MBV61304.1 fructose-6-phosphate aldolase [Nevskiales bacterium]PWN56436.1 fructose-6-phosphate aldolase [Abyssibacter profundi]